VNKKERKNGLSGRKRKRRKKEKVRNREGLRFLFFFFESQNLAKKKKMNDQISSGVSWIWCAGED